MPSDSMQHSSNNLPEGYVPPAKNREQTNKYFDEIKNPSPSFFFGSEKTQGTSKKEEIATLQASMDKLEKDREVRRTSQQKINEVKGRSLREPRPALTHRLS